MNARDEAIAAIRSALRHRTGHAWSVTGGRGTSWGWITVTAPPRRQVRGQMTEPDRVALTEALGLETLVPAQGEMIPDGSDYRQEYIDRARGLQPVAVGRPYWD